MDSKKSPKADLGKKSAMFFMIGITLSLLFVLIVFQYRQEISQPILEDRPIEAGLGPDIPITITPVKELEKPETPKFDINENLPPEEGEDHSPKLDWDKLLNTEENPEEGVDDIGEEEELEEEPLEFYMMEKMARPSDCELAINIDEQKRCFNDWINEYINLNTKYPAVAQKLRLEDKVYVSFIISKSGEVESAEVVRGNYESLNTEALRVIENMPTFVPGTQRGKKVKMKMTIPVNFKLSR
ncbi:TonB family protein [Owenweeksia hongkongensis DSM 17368]|uniref:TonB family protein n=1 Tax=Owenweeksia hongkongensis (strain DSM 17368 / CIP 108786 / JCM 12287 / NRRL B-23963 / UST20020801) TaxID=926562 RepID=G8R299_OWEHD|nr:TonB family protein [Owenweeksia hongkongensis]AEV32889.1 TonB family protein [Owenweeksia hongkongensis DSM 17368]